PSTAGRLARGGRAPPREPLPALVGRAELGLQRGDAVLDALVVDPTNRLGVGSRREAHTIGRHVSSRLSSRPSFCRRSNSASVFATPSASEVGGAGPRSFW